MDLIYMDKSRNDIGVMPGYDLDLAYGADENNFACTIQGADHCCDTGFYIYAEETEYGGIVDAIEVDGGEVTYSGRTWHGILGSKIIEPLNSSDATKNGVTVKKTDADGTLVGKYLVISGEANDCIRFLIDRLGLTDLFTAPTDNSGANVDEYQFWRYVDGYQGICKMLESAGMRLCVSYRDEKVILSAKPIHDYSQDEEFDPDDISMALEKKGASVNHLICLGSGDLENRIVVHLYADASGNISQTQSQFGLNEYSAVYDYSSAESVEELIENGADKLRKMWEPGKMDIDLDDESGKYHIGDKVGTTDRVTGISAVAVIRKKIVKVKNGILTISYKVGE